MKINPSFGGRWFNTYEHSCKYDIAESFVPALTLDELLSISGEDKQAVLTQITELQLGYGENRCGSKLFRQAVAAMYETMDEECILSTHAGVGANQLVFSTLHEGDGEIITIMPTYQQLRSYPEVIGANIKEYVLREDNHYSIDCDELRKMITPNTKLISLCNPNNPYGKLFNKEELEALAQVAREADCYILCDEIYSGLGTKPYLNQVSMCDIYEKGITTFSMSKTFSLPGLRLGWIATKDKALLQQIADMRHYHTMECSVLLEYIAAIAIRNRAAIINRNQTVVDENFEFFKEWIAAEPHLSFEKPDAGVVLIVKYDYEMTSVDFCKNVVEETGVMLMPGQAFELEGCFRIGLTAYPHVFRKALEVLSEFLKKAY